MIKNRFFIAIIVIIFSNCQKKDSNIPQKIDEIEFSYISSRRIPFSEVKIQIARMPSNDSAIAFVQTRPASTDPKWQYSKIEKFITIDLQYFEKFANEASSFDKINMDKAHEYGHDGSTWEIQFGSKGKNKSYRFWSPDYNTKERDLTAFVNLCEQIVEVSKLEKEQILGD